MTDHELLEAAAGPAGLTIEYWAQDGYPVVRDGNTNVGWNPLKFDSDALRLAAALAMDVYVRHEWVEAVAPMGAPQKVWYEADGEKNRYWAVKRAIVLAAVSMPVRRLFGDA